MNQSQIDELVIDADPFLQRMSDEYKELTWKVLSLKTFIDSDKITSIDPHAASLLKIQLSVMISYKEVLLERIKFHLEPYIKLKGNSDGKSTSTD